MAKRILVVEDERSTSDLLRVVLEERGYQVLTAFNGVEGLEWAREERPDLILLDLGLPQLDGFKVLEAVRSAPTLKDIPVIVCTQKDQVSEVEKALALGATAYMTKPFDLARLNKKIESLLGR